MKSLITPFFVKLSLETPTSHQIVYVDQAGVDDTHDYPYGYGPQGERFYALKLGHRTERISMVAGWCDRQIVAPMTSKGYCNTLLMKGWVEHMLVPVLPPGRVVVMDNASFHKSEPLRELIEQAGCELLLLPPYSPDFNKIEKFWAGLKQYLGQTLALFDCLQDAVDDAFRKLSSVALTVGRFFGADQRYRVSPDGEMLRGRRSHQSSTHYYGVVLHPRSETLDYSLLKKMPLSSQ